MLLNLRACSVTAHEAAAAVAVGVVAMDPAAAIHDWRVIPSGKTIRSCEEAGVACD